MNEVIRGDAAPDHFVAADLAEVRMPPEASTA
jgi:hypothetical protein